MTNTNSLPKWIPTGAYDLQLGHEDKPNRPQWEIQTEWQSVRVWENGVLIAVFRTWQCAENYLRGIELRNRERGWTVNRIDFQELVVTDGDTEYYYFAED